jgi:hypothetical protein
MEFGCRHRKRAADAATGYKQAIWIHCKQIPQILRCIEYIVNWPCCPFSPPRVGTISVRYKLEQILD